MLKYSLLGFLLGLKKKTLYLAVIPLTQCDKIWMAFSTKFIWNLSLCLHYYLWIPIETIYKLESRGFVLACVYFPFVRSEFSLWLRDKKSIYTWATHSCWASQVAPVIKNSPDNAGDTRDVGSGSGLWRYPRGRAWEPTPVFLPGEYQRQKSLAGYSQGRRVRH